MPLQTSGAISLNQIHVEAGGSSGTQASINDSDIRALIGKSSGAQMSFSEWYGASASQTIASGNSSYAAATQYSGPIHLMGVTNTLQVLITHYVSPISITINNRAAQWTSLGFGHANNSLGLTIADMGTTATSYNNFPANSGWSTLTLSGGASRTLQRSAATFTGTTQTIVVGGVQTIRSAGNWSWANQTNPFPNSNNTTSFTITLS